MTEIFLLFQLVMNFLVSRKKIILKTTFGCWKEYYELKSTKDYLTCPGKSENDEKKNKELKTLAPENRETSTAWLSHIK